MENSGNGQIVGVRVMTCPPFPNSLFPIPNSQIQKSPDCLSNSRGSLFCTCVVTAGDSYLQRPAIQTQPPPCFFQCPATHLPPWRGGVTHLPPTHTCLWLRQDQ